MPHENLYVRIPHELSEKLENHLEKTKKTKVSVVIEALESYLRGDKNGDTSSD